MKNYLPNHENVLVLGRTVRTNPLPLFWTASGIELRTDSSELWLDVESDYELWEEWIRIEVDGFCMQRMLLPKGRSKICAFRRFPMDTVRTIRVLKEVQPVRDDEKKQLLLHGISCDGELYEIPQKKYKLEFIGDSLTSGEGLSGSTKLFGAGSAMFGIEGHYALTIAKHFEADFRLLAQNGWGTYCSCYNDRIRIMPKYYEQVCGVVTGEANKALGAFKEHDFQSWQPDAVIVNLGSNDGFALDREAWIDPEDGKAYRQISNPYGGVEQESVLRFEHAVIDFIKKIRSCNPQSYIVWAYGMCDHTMMPYLQKAVEQYKVEFRDERAVFQPLPATIDRWIGSSHHPGVKAHGYAAEVLIDKLQELLGK